MSIPPDHGGPTNLDPTHSRMLYALLKRRRDQRAHGWASIGELMAETRSTQQEVVAELRALFAHYKLEFIAGNGIVNNRYRIDPDLKLDIDALPEPAPRVRPKPEPIPDDQEEAAPLRAATVPEVVVAAVISAANRVVQPSYVKEPSGKVKTLIAAPPVGAPGSLPGPGGASPGAAGVDSKRSTPKLLRKTSSRVAIALEDAVRIGQQAVEVMLKEAPVIKTKPPARMKLEKSQPSTVPGKSIQSAKKVANKNPSAPKKPVAKRAKH